jgi:hypothetical protein
MTRPSWSDRCSDWWNSPTEGDLNVARLGDALFGLADALNAYDDYCDLLLQSRLSFRELVSDLTDELNYLNQVRRPLRGPRFERFSGILRSRNARTAHEAFDAMSYEETYSVMRAWEDVLLQEQQWTSSLAQTGIEHIRWVLQHLASYSQPYVERVGALGMQLWFRDRQRS